MSLRSLGEDLEKHRRGHHITLVLRFGKMRHITVNQVFGHRVVYFTKL